MRETVWISFVFGFVLLFIGCQSQEEIKRQKYITEGKQLYKTYCANCHQPDGTGLANLYPPLNGSDYLVKKDSVICLIRHGQQGPIVVNGQPYNRIMPANPQLSELEIAEIVTYIYNKWGNEKVVTDIKTVRNQLNKCPKP
ncbi:hypothetical protein GCM10023189_23340 [Nibrella saemangeumensis]|uniref:Cytochrome c domain-containing protein n=1 Tax=Nibrella saemangeumensis TaxID=1084526 RepID=A0ABP8MV63_9BACT